MEEEARLIQIIQDLSKLGKTPTSSKFWNEVSKQMDNTRSAKQCSNKWYGVSVRLINDRFIICRNGSLSPTVQNVGRTPRWRPTDSKKLVQKYVRNEVSHWI